MKRLMVVAFCALSAAAAMSGLIVVSRRPEKPVSLVEGVSDDPAVSAILARSCQDCHSERTRWPWYGHIPPMSLMLSHDIKEARSHMDFTLWTRYSPDDKRQILTELSAAVRNNQMPPSRYLWMHPDAGLSTEEAALLSAWTRSERHKLRAAAARGNGASQ